MNCAYRFFLIISVSGLLFVNNALSQTLSDEAILKKLDIYSKANPSNLLFVHTDKTIYTNNETLWFSAYLIKSETVNPKEHTILSVALMREDNRQVYLQDKYAMQEGLSFGSLSLPDSIPPGNYQFIASTNILDKNAKPVALFTQSLTIKSITEQKFSATLSLLDTVIKNGIVRVNVTVSIRDPDPKQKQKATIEYNVGKEASRSIVLNENSYIISVPAAQLSQAQPVMLTSVKYNNAVQYLSLKLPEIRSQGINVRFFPEGGNLSDGLESTVGWETKTTHDLPVAIRGILYKDDQPVDTITTNSYGIGSFRLKPESKSNYTLKVAANTFLNHDTICGLPKVLTNGIVMHLADAIINDTLRINLFSKEVTKVRVFIHNYHEAFGSIETEATPSGTKKSIVMPFIPKGIAIVTILDMQGRPLTERLFFAHYEQKTIAGIQADKQVYNKKDSAHVKIRLLDKDGAPVQGIVSIAAVQDNRIESSRQQDIESYVYLTHDLGYLPPDPQGRGFRNKNYLEDILLVKGWRRYTWQALMDSSPKDTVLQVQSPIIKGNVKYYDKPLKKPISLSIFRDTLFDLVTTESDGSFVLGRQKLLIREGRKIFLIANQKALNGYDIKVDDPFIPINQKLTDQVEIPNTGIAQSTQTSSGLQLKDLQRAIALETVTIKADKDDGFLFGVKHGSNACGDYVCRYNILNCPNHPNEFDNTQPVEGKTYQGRTYMGCMLTKHEKVSDVRGIYLSREFYGVNMDSVGLTEPQFVSTLFWKPGILINEKGQTEFSFYTGDITGKFRIVIQGVSNKDMIFGEGDFVVK